MRSPRRIVQFAFAALIAALAGLWSPATLAHAAHHAGHAVPCAEMQAAAGTVNTPDTAPDERIVVVAAIDDPTGKHHAACRSGCCAGGASCASPIAGPPAASLGLPDAGRPAFDAPRENALAQSPCERLPKPPRG